MGRKEYLQKELDLLLEKLRFWRYVIFGITSGVIWFIFGLTQGNIKINTGSMILLILAFASTVVAIKRIDTLTKIYQKTLKLLEKEE